MGVERRDAVTRGNRGGTCGTRVCSLKPAEGSQPPSLQLVDLSILVGG